METTMYGDLVMIYPTEEYLTIPDAAKYIKVSVSTIRRLITDKKITAKRVRRNVRIARSELDRYMQEPQN